MIEADWNTVAQALILALSTWYMRRGSKKDSESVKKITAHQSTTLEILDRVKRLEFEVYLIKQTEGFKYGNAEGIRTEGSGANGFGGSEERGFKCGGGSCRTSS